jgi:hypothetical protein
MEERFTEKAHVVIPQDHVKKATRAIYAVWIIYAACLAASLKAPLLGGLTTSLDRSTSKCPCESISDPGGISLAAKFLACQFPHVHHCQRTSP